MDTETESDQSEPSEKPHEREAGDMLSHVGYFFLPSWLRYRIQGYSRCDRFLLAYNLCFLLPVSIIFYFLFFTITIS